jgi:hypothetical protein
MSEQRQVTRADRAAAVARMLTRLRSEDRQLRLTVGQRAHILGESVAEVRRRDIPSDPNPWPYLRLIGPWKRRTGVPSRWLGRWGRDGTQSEWEDA